MDPFIFIFQKNTIQVSNGFQWVCTFRMTRWGQIISEEKYELSIKKKKKKKRGHPHNAHEPQLKKNEFVVSETKHDKLAKHDKTRKRQDENQTIKFQISTQRPLCRITNIKYIVRKKFKRIHKKTKDHIY